MILADKRIFIIEDSIANQAIMELLLEQYGATIMFGQWGSEVLSQLRSFAPVDLIILDLMLPDGTTGYDIFDAIRSDPAFETIPILTVSAADPDTALPEAQARGFSGFISKPIRYNLFAQQVAQVIEGNPIWYIDT
jgi:CheY-like chemotaxis protein